MAIKNQHKVVLGVVVGVLVFSAILIGMSLKRLESHEVALKYNTIQKTLGQESEREGLHSGPPGFEFIKFPSVFKSITFTDLECLNKDGVEIELDVAYQYVVRAAKLKEIIEQFRNHESYLKVLQYSGGAALHEACSYYNTSQFQAERGAFQESVRQLMKSRYDQLHADVTDLQVNNIQRPRQYETAIKAKEAARENIKVAENERPRKITKAETKRREAETQAKITVDKAKSNARILENKANAEATGILNTYDREAETYANLISSSGLNLDTTGFLSYIGVRAIASAKNPVYIGMKGPAKTAYP